MPNIQGRDRSSLHSDLLACFGVSRRIHANAAHRIARSRCTSDISLSFPYSRPQSEFQTSCSSITFIQHSILCGDISISYSISGVSLPMAPELD